MKTTDKKNEKNIKKQECGVITCIHRVMGSCSLDTCELQERTLMQES